MAMLKRAIIVVQTHLNGMGLFAGNADGVTGPGLDAGVLAALTRRPADIPAGATGFPAKRRMTMLFQLICKDRGIDCDPVDGFWGPVTQDAHERLVHLIDRGTLPPNWRDDEPSDANPHVWPRDTGNQAAMRAFYGPPGAPPITRVRVPWRLRLAWDRSQTVTHIGCHAKVAGSLDAVLQKVHAHYGEEELRRLRLDLFGGCFANRKKRGGSTWSTHAWAVALDWDPERNQLKWGRDRASLDAADYDFWWRAWEAEGWVSLGRSRNFDWMHVQAARL
jgi:hypothetical protein